MPQYVCIYIYRYERQPGEHDSAEQTAEVQPKALNRRVNSHSNPHLQCTTCGHISKCHAQLKIHIAGRHNKIRSHKCGFCFNTYLYANNLKNHITYKHGLLSKRRPIQPLKPKKPRSYLCTMCDVTTACPAELKNHVSGVHNNLYRFNCPSCDNTYKYVSNLNRHRVLKHNHFSHGHHPR